MSVAFVGSCAFAMYTAAPHVNITIASTNGMIVHTASRRSEPSMCGGRSASERRRYLTEKNTTRKQIKRAKKPLTASRKKYSASTWPEIVDALSGKSGKSFHIAGQPPTCTCVAFRSRRSITTMKPSSAATVAAPRKRIVHRI